MDRDLAKIIRISLVVLIFGGVSALIALWDAVFHILIIRNNLHFRNY